MPKRPGRLQAGLACVVFAAAGFSAALPQLRRLLGPPAEEYKELLRVPHPHTTEWLSGVQRAVSALDAGERAIAGITLVLLLGALALLGRLLNPEFGLLKPPEERVGTGGQAHVDGGRVFRFAAAAVLSLWLAGAFGPIAALARGGPVRTVLAGLPAWLAPANGFAQCVLLSLALFFALWSLWGPGGVATPSTPLPALDRVLWGVLAGLAAVPAVVALYALPSWLSTIASVYSLADRRGWAWLLALFMARAPLAGLYLALVALFFRPRAWKWELARQPLLGAGAALLLGIGMAWPVDGRVRAIRREDAAGLAATLGYHDVQLERFAILLTPDGQAMYSTTLDGSSGANGGDYLACRLNSIEATARLLEKTAYRTPLAGRAYFHLHDCASLDWWPPNHLKWSLLMLDHAPRAIAADMLLQRLSDCPPLPEYRAYLDRLADTRLYAWPDELKNWLGFAYLRFGDIAKARQYVKVPDRTPLTDGIVRGRLTINGAPVESIKVGLFRAPHWREMAGLCRPFAWRSVTQMTYTDKNGGFEFRNVPGGPYLMLLTNGPIGRERGHPVVANGPGVFFVGHRQPVVELPPFDIRFERRMPGTSTL